IRQVARVSQMIPLVIRSVLVRPHRRPPNRSAFLESQPIHETQQLSDQRSPAIAMRKAFDAENFCRKNGSAQHDVYDGITQFFVTVLGSGSWTTSGRSRQGRAI
ncbi:MAG TPA: hypothetical protein VJY34_15050, partial [Roseiarcus sp.]|nr:hypothetical protein [Roseiarcus sp.]